MAHDKKDLKTANSPASLKSKQSTGANKQKAGAQSSATQSKKVAKKKVTEKKIAKKKVSASAKTSKPTADTQKTSSQQTNAQNTKPVPSTQAPSAHKETTAVQAVASTTSDQSPAPKAPKSGRGLAGIALLFSLLALAAGGYAAYQSSLDQKISSVQNTGFDDRLKGFDDRLSVMSADQQSLKSRQDGLASKADSLGESVHADLKRIDESVNVEVKRLDENIKADVQRMSEELSSAQGVIQSLQTSSNSSIEDIKADLGQAVARWRLDEVHSLLSQINQFYRLSGDKVQATAGLTLAQSTLSTIHNTRLEPVRAALAEDILALDAQISIDVTALSNRLMSIRNILPSLIFVGETERLQALKAASENPDQAAAAEPEADDGLLSIGKSILGDLGGLVKHKRLDAPLKPSLDDSAKYAILASLQLNLEGAMVALLRRDNEAYQSQLMLASERLSANFDTVKPEAKSVLEEIASLQSEEVSLKVERISKALDALNHVMAGG